jgi:hypothetical protein
MAERATTDEAGSRIRVQAIPGGPGPPGIITATERGHVSSLPHPRASLRVIVALMGVIRSLLLALSLIAFLVLALVANVGLWAMTTFLDSDAFAATTTRIIERPQVRALLAERLAERLTELVVPDPAHVPATVRRALGLTAAATVADVRAGLVRAVAAALADPNLVVIEQDAIADLHRAVLALVAASSAAPGEDASVTLDLNAVVTALDARLDPNASGFLGQPLPPALGTLTLARSGELAWLAHLLQVLEAIRWLLPALCAMSALLVLLLARARLHAIAWLGLCLLLVGAASLLAASSAPLIASKVLGSRPDTLASTETTLYGLMGGLITQSAVVAGLGLAMLVVGVTGGIVTGRGDGRDRADGYG